MRSDAGTSRRGQILVVFALTVIVILTIVALVLEAGNVFSHQRMAQNGSDATANAGTVVIAEKLGGSLRTGAQVAAAVSAAAAANGLENPTAEYVDGFGRPFTPSIPVTALTPIPVNARGVHAVGQRTAGTTFGRVIGINGFTANAEATAVAGRLSGVCAADSGCRVLPATFPVTVAVCDSSGTYYIRPGDPQWPYVSAEYVGDPTKEAILPLCKVDSGSFGWLDLGPGNLGEEITGPQHQSFDIPTWLQTQTGNPNSVEDELNSWIGTPVLIPLFDGTCRVNPGDASSAETCPEDQRGVDPVGNNTWYHIPYFTTFVIDRAYTQGANVNECAGPPGREPVDPSSPGFLGCIKGWFVNYVTEGPIDPDGPIPEGSAIGMQLIK